MKFKKAGMHYASEDGSATVVNNKHCDNDCTGWDLYVDSEFCGNFKTKKEAVENAQEYF